MSSPPKFWEGLAAAVGHPEMLELPEFADRLSRIANYEKVLAFLAPLFKQASLDEWCTRLSQHEVPHSPVYNSEQVLASDQARHLQLEVAADHPTMGRFRTIRFPVSFDGERALEVTAPPVLGEHNEELLGGRDSQAAAE
jgi:crotonobetainyl-CoA:carnitine CoA-transferase CaiB-like acyl-CoA transferase